jgi:hypothetical protein
VVKKRIPSEGCCTCGVKKNYGEPFTENGVFSLLYVSAQSAHDMNMLDLQELCRFVETKNRYQKPSVQLDTSPLSS